MKVDFELLQSLLDHLDGPDTRVDILIEAMLDGGNNSATPPPYTASLDTAIGLVNRQLPGWIWRVMSCSVSDDVWVTPDFNDPVHGERLRQEWPEECQADPLGYLKTDLDRRPSGQPAIALLKSLVVANATSPLINQRPVFQKLTKLLLFSMVEPRFTTSPSTNSTRGLSAGGELERAISDSAARLPIS